MDYFVIFPLVFLLAPRSTWMKLDLFYWQGFGKQECHQDVTQELLFPFRWDVPDSKTGRAERFPEPFPALHCSAVALITAQSRVRRKQLWSNRCRSVRKANARSLPCCSSLPLPGGTSATRCSTGTLLVQLLTVLQMFAQRLTEMKHEERG